MYHDLYSAFNDWNGIWDAASSHLGELYENVYKQVGSRKVLKRMQDLNKATATNIMLRETLGMQNKSLQVITKMAKRHYRDGNHLEAPGYDEFLERCTEMSDSLEHYAVLAKGNEEQLQNLLSLMVSMEQISQGQSMGQLNILAFTFLPLSFMASIFGMTQFTMATRWYPAFAIPALFLTVLVATLMPAFASILDRLKRDRKSVV